MPRSKYKRMLRKADKAITKELDMVRFVKRARMQSLFLLSRLSSYDYFFVDKMTDFYIEEKTLCKDSSSEYTSSDNLEIGMRSDTDHFGSITKVSESNALESKELFKLYKVIQISKLSKKTSKRPKHDQ